MIKKYNNFLNEVILNLKPVNPKIYKVNSIVPNYVDYKYDFTTNSGNNYSLYLEFQLENDLMFNDTIKLSDSCDKYNDKLIVPTFLFSLTQRDADPNTFDNLTNLDEKYEVLGKICYIIRDFIDKNKYNAYSIGKVDDKKYRFYKLYLDKFFDDFAIYESTSENYLNGAYYLIKK